MSGTSANWSLFINSSKTFSILIPRGLSWFAISVYSLRCFIYICSRQLCFVSQKGLLRMQNFPFIFKILYPSFTTNLFSSPCLSVSFLDRNENMNEKIFIRAFSFSFLFALFVPPFVYLCVTQLLCHLWFCVIFAYY